MSVDSRIKPFLAMKQRHLEVVEHLKKYWSVLPTQTYWIAGGCLSAHNNIRDIDIFKPMSSSLPEPDMPGVVKVADTSSAKTYIIQGDKSIPPLQICYKEQPC